MEINSIEKFESWKQDFVVCDYAKKLIDKLVHLNSATSNQPADIEIIKKAIYYAKKYHGDQKRQSGEPFYSHPLEVAYVLSDYLFRTDIIVTAILHDTIEDTELTKEEIAQEFGTQIANQVMDLTRIKEDGTKISSAKMLELLYIEGKYDILLVKLFDRIHNMQTIRVKSHNKVEKIITETLLNFVGLGIYLQDYLTRVNDSSTKLLTLDAIINNLCYMSILPKPKQAITRELLDGCQYHLPDMFKYTKFV